MKQKKAQRETDPPKKQNAKQQAAKKPEPGPSRERRAFGRLDVPATAFAVDAQGKEMGRVAETSGGGLLLDPASPWARLGLVKGQQLVISIVEPATGNKTDVRVEVRRVNTQSIGLRFL